MIKRLFIDDIRDAPDESWVLARTITEAIRLIAQFGDSIEEISLDHDISAEVRVNGVYRPFPTDENFSAVAYYIAEKYRNETIFTPGSDINGMPCIKKWYPKITVHSSNPVGSENMQAILKNYGILAELKPMGQAYRPK